MGKRGPKPKGKVKIIWSAKFAYAIGLLVSDGNLSPNGRHINFTTKEQELVDLFQTALDITASVTMKRRGDGTEKKYFAVQFGDVLFYDFLVSIGLMPNKSKIIKRVEIPPKFFFNYLLGLFDGDGCTYSYYDPRWKSSFMFYTVFVSASQDHILWLQDEIYKRLKIKGHITSGKCFQLKYAKADSQVLLPKMYQKSTKMCLTRKRLKIEAMLRIIGQRL